MMKQMGMSQEDLSASEVIIKTENKILKFTNPSIQKVVMKGQTTFQLSGDYIEEEISFKSKISTDDINTVKMQAGVSEDEAMKALDNANGDIAQAIINLTN